MAIVTLAMIPVVRGSLLSLDLSKGKAHHSNPKLEVVDERIDPVVEHIKEIGAEANV